MTPCVHVARIRLEEQFVENESPLGTAVGGSEIEADRGDASEIETGVVDQEIRQALKIADYVYVLELGRNKFDGPVEDFTSPQDLKKAFWA